MIKIEQIVSKYLDKVGERIVIDAKDNVPVKTGALRDSIQMQKNGDKSIYVGSDKEYAIYLELGTRHITPRAFLRRAVYNRNNYRA